MSWRMFSRKGRIRPGTRWYFFRIRDSDRLFRIQIPWACHKSNGSDIRERIHNNAWVNSLLKKANLLQVLQSLPIIDVYTNTLALRKLVWRCPVFSANVISEFGSLSTPVLFLVLLYVICKFVLWHRFFLFLPIPFLRPVLAPVFCSCPCLCPCLRLSSGPFIYLHFALFFSMPFRCPCPCLCPFMAFVLTTITVTVNVFVSRSRFLPCLSHCTVPPWLSVLWVPNFTQSP